MLDLAQPRADVRCQACKILFDRRRGERRALPAGARPAAAARRLRARRRRLGGAAPPGRHGVLLPQHGPGPGAWRSTRARWGRPSRCSSSTRGRSSSGPTRCSATLEPDVEALLVNRARGARQHFLVPIDECYALVGADPHALARASPAARRSGRRSSGFFEELDRRAKPATPDTGGGHMAKLKVGKPDTTTDAPAHIDGRQAGQREGQLREAGRATLPDGRATARAVDGHQPEARASRSTTRMPNLPACRGARCSPSRGPLAGRPRSSPFAVARRRRARARRRADAALRAADRTARRGRRCGRSRSTRQVRIAATPARATTRRERERLFELFGPPEDWGRNLQHAALDAT